MTGMVCAPCQLGRWHPLCLCCTFPHPPNHLHVLFCPSLNAGAAARGPGCAAGPAAGHPAGRAAAAAPHDVAPQGLGWVPLLGGCSGCNPCQFAYKPRSRVCCGSVLLASPTAVPNSPHTPQTLTPHHLAQTSARAPTSPAPRPTAGATSRRCSRWGCRQPPGGPPRSSTTTPPGAMRARVPEKRAAPPT